MRRVLLLLACFLASAQAQDLLGHTFSTKTFALCRAYSCRVLSTDNEVVKLQLLQHDAQVFLYLSGGVVMGLDVWVSSLQVSQQQKQFLLNVAERAAEQKLSLPQLEQCWAKVSPEKSRLVLGGGGEHYGVECLRRGGKGQRFLGLRIYFDL